MTSHICIFSLVSLQFNFFFFPSILSYVGLLVCIKIIACPRNVHGTYVTKDDNGFIRFPFYLYLVYILQFMTDLIVFLWFKISLNAKQHLHCETAVSSASSTQSISA